MMIAIDAQALIALAALIASISSLVWSIRRSAGTPVSQADRLAGGESHNQ